MGGIEGEDGEYSKLVVITRERGPDTGESPMEVALH